MNIISETSNTQVRLIKTHPIILVLKIAADVAYWNFVRPANHLSLASIHRA